MRRSWPPHYRNHIWQAGSLHYDLAALPHDAPHGPAKFRASDGIRGLGLPLDPLMQRRSLPQPDLQGPALPLPDAAATMDAVGSNEGHAIGHVRGDCRFSREQPAGKLGIVEQVITEVA